MRRIVVPVIALAIAAAIPVACTTPEPEAEPTDELATEGAPASEDTEPQGAAAASGAEVYAFEEAETGGTLIIGLGQEPDQLYIYGGSMLAAAHVQNALYDGPIEGMDYDFQPVILEELPKLEDPGSGATLEIVSVEEGEPYVHPESQEVVTATETVTDLPQLSVEFRMVDGVTWEDGAAVTADDSVFSQRLACHPDTPSSKYLCDRTAGYTAIDDKTTEWQGLPGYTDQTYFANFYTPLPRHQVGADDITMEEMEPGDIPQDEVFTRRPLSYGPFKMVEWESDDHITLQRNEYYWRAEEGLPFLDSIILKFIPDSNAVLAALISGEIDVATQDGLDISQYDPITAAEEAGDLVAHFVAGTVWEHIDFNLDPVDERVPFGACAHVREAMALGTDRDTMVEVILKGRTRIQHTIVPEEHWAYPEDEYLTKYPFDADRARQILAENGWEDTDGDGIVEASEEIVCEITVDLDGGTKEQVIPEGTPLELDLYATAGNLMRQDTTLLFQQNMENIGIQIDLEFMDSNVYFSDGPDGPLFGRRYDLGEFSWLTGVMPSVALYFCTQVPAEENRWAGQNQTGWCDPQYDRIGKEALNILERTDALPLYHEAQKIFMENLPVIPLFARVKVMATKPEVANFAPNPTVNSETWNMEVWGFAKTEEAETEE